MTIQQAIDAARVQRDTEIPDEVLVGWLSSMDENLYERVLSKYGYDKPETLPYPTWLAEHDADHETAEDVELMLEDRYGLELYPLYLVMRTDLQHGDIDRYNNDAILYNELEVAMRKDISREKKWKPPRPDGWPESRPWDGRINIRF